MKLSNRALVEIKKKAANHFLKHPEVRFAFLFGSLTQGRATSLSDVDLAVYLDDSTLSVKNKRRSFDVKTVLTTELMGVLKTNEVDLVVLNEAPPLLRHRILTQGERLMARDPLQEQRFFVRTLQDYFDTSPLRALQAKYLKDYLHGLGKSAGRPGLG